jgi:hypothetical protein
LLLIPLSQMLGAFSSSSLIKISCFRRPTGVLLDISTLFNGDLTVVSRPRDFAAILGRAAGEFLGYALVDSRFIGWQRY